MTLPEGNRNWLEEVLTKFIGSREEEGTAGTPGEMIAAAERRAFKMTTALGLIPGPLGLATIIPEMVALTKLQFTLIRRIARLFGQEERVTRELLLLILANAVGVGAGETIARRAGVAAVIKAADRVVFRKLAKKVGDRMVREAFGRAVSRWIPLITAPVFWLVFPFSYPEDRP